MPARARVSEADLLSAYAQTPNIATVGRRFGIRPSSVHERLVRLGAAQPRNVFTDEERARLQAEYWIAAETGKLGDLAASFGRTKQLLCRQAKDLGLTDPKRAKAYFSVWKYVTEEQARVIFEKFKRSGLNLREFCTKRSFDDLGFSRCMRQHFPDEWEHVIEAKQTSQTMYRFGRQFEYRVRDYLKGLGYVALRSPGSRTPIDIMAVRPGVVLFVQCKRGGALPPSEWNELFDLAQSVAALPVLASSPTRRGITFFLMLARKAGRGRQPMVSFDPSASSQIPRAA